MQDGHVSTEIEQTSIDGVVATFDESALPSAMATAAELRRADLRVDLYPDVARKMDKVFNTWISAIEVIAILGSDEVAAGTVTVRTSRRRPRDHPRDQAAGHRKSVSN